MSEKKRKRKPRPRKTDDPNFVETRGRPQKFVDVHLLEELAALHCTYKEMGDVLGVSDETLRTKYLDIIEKARSQNKVGLRRKLWDQAFKRDNFNAMVWLSKQDRHKGGLEFSEKIETKNENQDVTEFRIGWADEENETNQADPAKANPAPNKNTEES